MCSVIAMAVTSPTELTFTLGDRLALARRNAQMDQATLAQAIGVSRPTISKWERNLGEPGVSQAIAIAEATGVSFGALCGVEPRSRWISAWSPRVVEGDGPDAPTLPGMPKPGSRRRHLRSVPGGE